MDWNYWKAKLQGIIKRHADVAVGLLVWYIVGQIVGPRVGEWGIVTLALSIGAGIVAYLAVQKVFPESRG